MTEKKGRLPGRADDGGDVPALVVHRVAAGRAGLAPPAARERVHGEAIPEQGPHALVAGVVRGTPPAELGDRAGRPATVTWVGPDGRTRSETTTTPTRLVAKLAADSPDGEVPGLTVTRPGLEDVYLQLVGATPTTAEGDLR